MDEDEVLVERAKQVIIQSGKASTSYLQRRLRIGYNRAATLMDLLEDKGIIGPPTETGPRDILVDLDGDIPDAPEVAAEPDAVEPISEAEAPQNFPDDDDEYNSRESSA
jgi:hypothetical protein